MLFCQEILTEILAYLSPGWFPWDDSDRGLYASKIWQDVNVRKTCQRSLAACALTCRAVSDLALAELWRVLDYQVFLLRLLPWTLRDDGVFDEVLVRISPHSWTSTP